MRAEEPERHGVATETRIGVAVDRCEPVEGHAKVALLGSDSRHPGCVRHRVEARRSLLYESSDPVGVARPDLDVLVCACGQPLGRVLADGLEHPVARLARAVDAAAEEALVE